jgi:Ca2+-binding EF-hand superfamily protein
MTASCWLTALQLLITAPQPGDGFDLESRTAGKPALIRFRVEIDGKACRTSWEEYERRLFADLDRDSNGHLDRREAARVPSAAFLRSLLQADTETETAELTVPFSKLDTDGDGRVSQSELFAYYRREGIDPQVPVVREPQGTRGRLGEILFDRLDLNGDGKLSREELLHAADTLQPLDLDEDEWWTPAEIAPRGRPFPVMQSVGQRPTLCLASPGMRELERELLVRLGHRQASQAVFSLVFPKSSSREMRGETAILSTGTVTIQVETANRIESGFSSLRRLYLQDFQAADAENRGFVEERHLTDSDFLRSLLRLADRDGDGKLTLAELRGFLDLHAFGSASLVTASLIDESRGLFDLLDANGDGRLSLRELKGAWERLKSFDSNGDGYITRAELPRVYRLRFCQGFERQGRVTEKDTAFPVVKKEGPAWFRQMDRNGDGDVSPREFLGPPELFRKLDRNGDGLISKEEAEQFKASVRPSPRR